MSKYITDIHQQHPIVNGIYHEPCQWDGLFPELIAFLNEWFDDSDTVEVHTSGSTGTPKAMQAEKQRMMNSAVMTLSYLNLHRGDSALLCMPLKYIAGKMVVVRSLVGDLNLIPVTPSGHPLQGLKESPDFAAMIPMQVYNSLQIPEEYRLLQGIKHLIIGGGSIDTHLEKALKNFPNDVWSTYGMTETLSHIAMRKLNGKDASAWYTPLKGVNLSESAEGTLIIDAPDVCKDPLQTNDLVEFNVQRQFRILGRKDNVINTGGIKVRTEEVEAALKPLLPYPFLITSAPDEKFGERIVLLLEQPENKKVSLSPDTFSSLPLYWRPKQVVSVSSLPLTETGKPDRARAKRMVVD